MRKGRFILPAPAGHMGQRALHALVGSIINCVGESKKTLLSLKTPHSLLKRALNLPFLHNAKILFNELSMTLSIPKLLFHCAPIFKPM